MPNGTTDDIFIHDRATGQKDVVSIASDGSQGNQASFYPTVSTEGRYVAFDSSANNLVSNDTGMRDIFVHDRGSDNCGVATANKPILLITGWGGSVGKTLQTDSQLGYFKEWLGEYGYVEGCNLFYAGGTSPYLYLDQNAAIIANDLCAFATIAEQEIPNWNGYFDIIAHSYGGLRARTLLESDLYDNGLQCPATQQNVVKVDNLFTMGTPHGGEWPDLPFATIIGLNALGDFEWPALAEMMPPVRLWQNLSSSQPDGVDYYLLGGDARLQAATFPTGLFPIYWLWPFATVRNDPNDLAVHQSSAYALADLFWKYPDVTLIPTPDLHGDVYIEQPVLDPLHILRSFVYPETAFESEICPRMGLNGCQPLAQGYGSQEVSQSEMLQRQMQPQPMATAPLMDVAAGQLAANEVISGQFEMDGVGSSQVNLSWSEGDLTLVLADSLGNVINEPTAAADPNIGYFDLNTGFGLMASYQITDTLTGTWTYTITASALNQPEAYRLLVVPATPIAVSGSVPAWLPNNSPIVVTATVTYLATTPVTGGSVTAHIQRPDDTAETITLFDDGQHQDGIANDGVFGAIYDQTYTGGFYGILFTATGDYNSETYERTAIAVLAIAPANASLNDQYSDSGIDENGNQLYEWLEVTAGVAVTEPATYTLSAELYAGGTFIAHTNQKLWLATDSQTMSLHFDGNETLCVNIVWDNPSLQFSVECEGEEEKNWFNRFLWLTSFDSKLWQKS